MSAVQDPSAIAVTVARRVYAIEAEARINLLRLVGVAVFFTLHVVNRAFVGLDAGRVVDLGGTKVPVFDTVAISVAVAWAGAAGAVLLLLRTRFVSRVVGPMVTLADVLFLSILVLVGNGPTSPMLYAFPLVIAVTGLRGRSADVWLATVATTAAYGLAIGAALRFHPSFMPPTHHILFVVASLGLMGLVTDLGVGSTWRLVEDQDALLGRARAVELTALEHRKAGDCPWCGAWNAGGARRCGRCDQPLVPAEGVFLAPSMARRGTVMLVWTASVVALVVVCVVVGVGLSMSWPALVVPYAGAVGVLLLGLARIVHLDLRGEKDDAMVGRTATVLGTAAGTVALSATMLSVLVAVGVLMSAAAGVVGMALCFATLAAVGSM